MPKEMHALSDHRKISSLKRDSQRGNKLKLLQALNYYFSIKMSCNTSQLLTRVPEGVVVEVFSPTRDGRVWDIQLEIIAMALRTAPSFSSGGLIAVELMSFHSAWLSSRCRLVVRGVTAAQNIHRLKGDWATHIQSSIKNIKNTLTCPLLSGLTNKA